MLNRMNSLLLCLTTVTWCLPMAISDYTPEALADQVDWSALPGADGLTVKDAFNMFAGYVTVDEENGRRIFYWFMEAQENAQEAPVILWTNGGPGCSGMLGLLMEHGPFQIRHDGEALVDNEYAWNKLANVLYVEIPSGVGFSYSDTPTDYKTGDDATAVDNYWFVQGWLDRFPDYRSNDFHISSESYGGHYMPQMAEEILKRNEQAKGGDDSPPPINFVGFLVGNPYTDAPSNQVAQYQAYWGDQLVPKPVYDEWLEACVEGGYRSHGNYDVCDQLEDAMDNYIGNLNPYALDFPMCLKSEDDTSDKEFPIRASGGGVSQHGTKSVIPRAPRVAMKENLRRAWRAEVEVEGLEGEEAGVHAAAVSTSYEPCAEDYTLTYFNRADVQEALHAKEGTYWLQCSWTLDYSKSDMLRPMMPYYQRLLDNYDISILVFSGDDDAVCATEGTQWWIYDLGYDVDEDCFWQTWEEGGQVAGYETRFKDVKLSFVTVHSAGHEVPAYQPARAFKLLSMYLDGSLWEPKGQEDSVANLSTTGRP